MLKIMGSHFSGVSDRGLLRDSNQDHYYIDGTGRFFILADGMGGYAGGEEASRLATETIKTVLEDHWTGEQSTVDLLKQALGAANAKILEQQQCYPEWADMGTTVVVLACRPTDAQPWCAHVGDSRLYRLRGNQLEQITEDHTWIARAVRAGQLSLDQSRNHPWRHLLFQCLGREDLTEVDIQPVPCQRGDLFLICSDGLTEELSDVLIADLMITLPSCEAAATALVNSAKQEGGRDNITVILFNPD
jgi:protein phosphatase